MQVEWSILYLKYKQGKTNRGYVWPQSAFDALFSYWISVFSCSCMAPHFHALQMCSSGYLWVLSCFRIRFFEGGGFFVFKGWKSQPNSAKLYSMQYLCRMKHLCFKKREEVVSGNLLYKHYCLSLRLWHLCQLTNIFLTLHKSTDEVLT